MNVILYRNPVDIMENRYKVVVRVSMSEKAGSRVLDHRKLVKEGRATARKERITVVQMTKDESMYK